MQSPVRGPSPRSEPPETDDADPTAAAEYAHARDLAGLVLRAPRRHRRLALSVFLLGAAASVAALVLTPRVYEVDTKILAQRNLVMSSLGNPRRAVPTESDAPTRSAGEAILGRESLTAIIQETDLLARWDSERPALLRLKDRAARALTGALSDEDRSRALVRVLEKKLQVQADESTIRISLEWSNPETAFLIVSCVEEGFFKGRRAAEVAVIADIIGILNEEVSRQREVVERAFALVMELRRQTLEIPAASEPPPEGAVAVARLAPRPAPLPARAPVDPGLTARLDEKRQAIRALDAPRQQKLAQTEADLARLRLTYAEAHPAVLQALAELLTLRMDPPGLADLKDDERKLVARLAELEQDARKPTARLPVAATLERTSRPAPAPRPRAGSGSNLVVEVSPHEDEPEVAAAKARLVSATNRYEDLLDRVDAARIEQLTAQAAFKYRYIVIEPPERPREAKRPNALVLGLGGIVLSLVLAVFAAAVKDLAGGRFVEAWQVRRKLSIPVLAEIDEP
jgi:hypothetical protein